MKAKKYFLIAGILVLGMMLMACNLTSLISQVSSAVSNEISNDSSSTESSSTESNSNESNSNDSNSNDSNSNDSNSNDSNSNDSNSNDSNSNDSNSNVLFSDNFSKTSSGWDRISDEYGENDYVDGTYQFRIDAANYDIWANPGKSFTDVVVDVDATLIDGSENNDFGVICRYQDAKNFYFAEIASDGYYIIGKYVDGDMSALGSDQMVETDLVNGGNTTNHIRFECNGSDLVLDINGSTADSETDTDLTYGDVGLIAGDYDTPGVVISFDDFVVTQP
jgi:hypothetical protein